MAACLPCWPRRSTLSSTSSSLPGRLGTTRRLGSMRGQREIRGCAGSTTPPGLPLRHSTGRSPNRLAISLAGSTPRQWCPRGTSSDSSTRRDAPVPATSGGSNARSERAVGRRRLRPPCGHRSASVRPSSAAEAMRGRPTPSISGRSVGLRSRRSETLIRNQDYELNWRLRQAGYVIWLDPALVVEYTPRASLRGLWSQYFQYGRWKRVVVFRSPRSLRARQLAAPGLVIGLAASLALLIAGSWLGLVLPAVYVSAVTGVAARIRNASTFRVALGFVTMHLAWGSGFLFGR